jgi:hypothetical protein
LGIFPEPIPLPEPAPLSEPIPARKVRTPNPRLYTPSTAINSEYVKSHVHKMALEREAKNAKKESMQFGPETIAQSAYDEFEE